MRKAYFLLFIFSFVAIALSYADSFHDNSTASKYSLDQIKNQSHRNSIGVGYVKPIGEDEKDIEAKLLKSAQKGKAKSQSKLGSFYYERQHYQEAFHWFMIATEKGLDNAQYHVGLSYQNGEGIEPNDTEAFKWFMLAAKQGNAAAQFQVGMYYQKGIGIEPNIEQAVYWWNQSAAKGNSNAQGDLGYCYFTGTGVSQDYVQAFKWLSKSAEKDNPMAQNYLGTCLYYGNGVSPNIEKAYYWYLLSSQNAFFDAEPNIDMTEKELTPKQITKIKGDAQQWLFSHYKE